MFWLSTSTIVRLRDQLRAAGQKASVAVAAAQPSEEDIDALIAEYGPFCEAMYLMMSADGEVSIEEREVLRGALQNLSGDSVDGELIDKMLEQAAARVAEDGRASRMREVIESLARDPSRAEVAFVLSAAIAFANNTIADEENSTLDDLADGLGIDEERASELLDAVEKDLG